MLISAIASSRAASIRKTMDGTYNHPMDISFIPGHVSICLQCIFSGWYTYNERKQRVVDVVDRAWEPNPLNGRRRGSEMELGGSR